MKKNSRNVYWQVGIRINDKSKNKLVKFFKKIKWILEIFSTQ